MPKPSRRPARQRQTDARQAKTLGLASFLTIASLAATGLAGCGGGGGSGTSAITTPTALTTYASQPYMSTKMTLTGIGTGSLSLSVSSDLKSIAGTFTLTPSSMESVAAGKATNPILAPSKVNGSTRQTGAAITIPVSGTVFVPGSSASFTTTGSYVDATGATVAVAITGSLPTLPATAGGALNIEIGTATYTTMFGVAPMVYVVVPPPTPAQYVATEIGPPAPGYSYDTLDSSAPGQADLNVKGQVASSWVSAAGGVFHAFLYTPGSGFTDLGGLAKTPNGYTVSFASGINDDGVVVGSSYDSQDNQHVVQFTNGAVQDTGLLDENKNAQYAVSINTSGQLTGTFQIGNNVHGFLYTSGTTQDLGTLGSTTTPDSYATALNAAGQVVGYSYTTLNNAKHAFLYSNGAMRDIGTLTNISTDTSYASAINASGQVVGTSIDTLGNSHSFLYSGGSMQNIDTKTDLSSNQSSAYSSYASSAASINDSGKIVGFIQDIRYANDYSAYVYSDGVQQNLNDITSGLGEITLYFAQKITNNGLILAQGEEGTGSSLTFHLLVLTPISAEARAAHPVYIGAHAHGVNRTYLPRWMAQRIAGNTKQR